MQLTLIVHCGLAVAWPTEMLLTCNSHSLDYPPPIDYHTFNVPGCQQNKGTIRCKKCLHSSALSTVLLPPKMPQRGSQYAHYSPCLPFTGITVQQTGSGTLFKAVSGRLVNIQFTYSRKLITHINWQYTFALEIISMNFLREVGFHELTLHSSSQKVCCEVHQGASQILEDKSLPKTFNVGASSNNMCILVSTGNTFAKCKLQGSLPVSLLRSCFQLP